MPKTLTMPRDQLKGIITSAIHAGNVTGKGATNLLKTADTIDEVAFGLYYNPSDQCGCPMNEAGYVDEDGDRTEKCNVDGLADPAISKFIEAFDRAICRKAFGGSGGYGKIVVE